MANRVSEADLQNLVNYLNKLTGNSLDYMTDGKANIGHYFICSAYGGHQLQQLVSVDGAAITPVGGGFFPKRELYAKIDNYIVRLQAAKP
jgi:hypothetical protein